jgi:nucleoside-diphosphate-sugar epimerase
MEEASIRAIHGAPRAGDVRDSQADTTAAVRDLGHAPRFSFEEGLRRTLEWYRGQGYRATLGLWRRPNRPA